MNKLKVIADPTQTLPTLDDLDNLPPEDPEREAFRRKLAFMRVRDKLFDEKDCVAPDTFACESVFLEFFLTGEMEDDFLLIARDFLTHEIANLSKEYDFSFIDDGTNRNSPEESFRFLILNLMMNAAKQGNEYAISLFYNLHKTYYKREYKQLKRFHSINAEEVAAIADDEPHSGPHSLARVLCCAKFYGIKIEPDCDFIYVYLEDVHRRMHEDESLLGFGFDPEKYEKTKQEVIEMFGDENALNDEQFEADLYVYKCMEYLGFVEDYADLCDDELMQGVDSRFLKMAF